MCFMKILTIHRHKVGDPRDRIEREKMARLEQAEGDMRNLRGRADRAISALDDRHKRNHWAESIERMIQGTL